MDSKNFKDKEFGCKCCGKVIPNSELKAVLELVRLRFGGSVVITSGTRCESHNKKVGGKTKSKHLLGSAADIVCNKATPRDVYDFLNDTFPNYYGLGCYVKQGFVHVDVRQEFWRKVYE